MSRTYLGSESPMARRARSRKYIPGTEGPRAGMDISKKRTGSSTRNNAMRNRVSKLRTGRYVKKDDPTRNWKRRGRSKSRHGKDGPSGIGTRRPTSAQKLGQKRMLEYRRRRSGQSGSSRTRTSSSRGKAPGSFGSSRDALRKSMRERRIKKYKAREERRKARRPAVHRTRDKSLPMWKRYGAKSEASWKGMSKKARGRERAKQDWERRKNFIRKNPNKFRGGIQMGATYRNGKLVGAFAGNKKNKKDRIEQWIKHKDQRYKRKWSR